MRLVSYDADGSGPRLGIQQGPHYLVDASDVAKDAADLLAGGPERWAALLAAAAQPPETRPLIKLESVAVLPVLPGPRRADFIPDGIEQFVPAELEAEATQARHTAFLAAVVRRRCKDIAAAEARDVVAGFVAGQALSHPDGGPWKAVQITPLVLPPAVPVPEGLTAPVYVDDEPQGRISGPSTGSWADAIAAASGSILRPGDWVGFADGGRLVKTGQTARVALAGGSSFGRCELRLV